MSAPRSPRAWAAWICYGGAAAAIVGLAVIGIGRDFALERELWWARASGWAASIALLLALSASPIGRVASRFVGRAVERPVAAFRRALGISAAALATLHGGVALATYLGGAIGPILEHAWLRAGALAAAILLVLWLTSHSRITRALRVKLWKPLHRLAFVAALFAFQHAMLSPFAPRAWVLAVFGLALGVTLLRFVPRPAARRRPHRPSLMIDAAPAARPRRPPGGAGTHGRGRGGT